MTLIEVTVLLIWVGCGAAVGLWVGTRYGLVVGFGGFVMGLSIAWVFGKGVSAAEKLWRKWRPMRPTCRNGRCVADDYEWLRTTSDGDVFACGCGDTYLLSSRGCSQTTHFWRLSTDGAPRPFMKHSLVGRWVREQSIGGP